MQKLMQLVDQLLPRPRLPLRYSEHYYVEFASDLLSITMQLPSDPDGWLPPAGWYGIQVMHLKDATDWELEMSAREIVAAFEERIANKEPSGPSCIVPPHNPLSYPGQASIADPLSHTLRHSWVFDWDNYAHV